MNAEKSDAPGNIIFQESLDELKSPENYLFSVNNYMMLDPRDEQQRLRTFCPFSNKNVKVCKLARAGWYHDMTTGFVKCHSCHVSSDPSSLLNGLDLFHAEDCRHVRGDDDMNVPMNASYHDACERLYDLLRSNQEQSPDAESHSGDYLTSGEATEGAPKPEDDEAQTRDPGFLKRDNVANLENKNRSDVVQTEPGSDSVPKKKKKTSVGDDREQASTDAEKTGPDANN